ncbi:MAG TPA: hypothetical protein VK645_15910 [Chitinophagaceae bacterium]|nr:hypothetical protein [Chitinophagaceae bacterium]
MDRNNYDNDFEEFLKQKSDQYKMYPSDRVWNNVYSSLHGRRKWWALGFTLFFIGTGLLVGKQVLLSNYNRMATQLNKTAETLSITKSSGSNAPHATHTYTPASPINKAVDRVVTHSVASATGNPESKSIPAATTKNGKIAIKETASTAETALVIENNLLPAVPVMSSNSNAGRSFSIPQKKLEINESITGKENTVKEALTRPINQVENAAAVESIKYSRWSLQFYASPTISYRRLSTLNLEGDNYVPVAANFAGNINRYVHHKPAPGFELGSNVQYKLSNSLTVFAGAQLNYSRYYIDAYKYQTEKASIALNNSTVHDTLSGYTNIRNFSGYEPEQLQNKYLQLSLPVGIEIKLLGEKKLQFSVAGGIQPTFLLSATSYLISSDYKNYIQSPDLARGFNVHTNFEAFISYKTGGLKWQVGPQFRSQLLSSYSNQYRVREYLTEYGIKFGVTRSF